MIILKSTHEAMLALKDQQLAAARSEVEWLRNFVQPAHSRPIYIAQEADAVLEGRHDVPLADQAPSEEIAAEAARVLSGNY